MDTLPTIPPVQRRLLKDRIFGGWAGKCLAGAIGMPYEGVPHSLMLKERDIVVQDVPNDDLELQLVWLTALERHGLELCSEHLAGFWTDHIRHGCDEYSVAIRNLRRGIRPPQSGQYDNWFHDGMGAAIRSEIWAMAFAGRPDAAAYYAEQDAVVDHWRDGAWAEIYLAAVESRVIESGNIEQALRDAREYVPNESRLGQAIDLVFELYDLGIAVDEARRLISGRLWHHNFTDCVMNLGFILFALLWGERDFIKTVLLAVNCGRDTDCTAATCGAILGLADGRAAIPKGLLSRLSPEIRLSPGIASIPGLPQTLDELCDRTLALNRRFASNLRQDYPAYCPTTSRIFENHDMAEWLVLDESEHDIECIKKRLLDERRCPKELAPFVMTSCGIRLNLSLFANGANTLNLFSYLDVSEDWIEQDTFLSVTADVGFTLWIDGQRIVNHHSRQLAVPSFHRTEGGAAFYYPITRGKSRLVHIRLYSCLPPLGCTLMLGNEFNDHIEGLILSMPRDF